MTITEKVGLTERQQAWVDGLRAMAGWAEANPEVIGDYPMGSYTFHGTLLGEPDEVREFLRMAARAMAPCDKVVPNYSPDSFHLVKNFGPHKVTVFADREVVCERRVVDTEDVEVEVYSDEAQAVIDSLPKVTVTETREIVEWDCSPLLGGAS